jgi:hypothetical protein
MKSIAALLVAFAAVALAASPQVTEVHTVYVLPMTNGLDQYLANRLTNLAVFQVVADPKKADAVLTDGLGAAFESRLEELFPVPPPEAPAEQAKKKAAQQGAKGAKGADETKVAEKAEPELDIKGDTGVRFSSFRRGKGTVFLVGAQSRAVLWSTYDRPKDASSAEMDRTAERIASRLKREIRGK